ncbi:LacI family DNA-binding transcriptional regulator [Actinomycetes bacterium KLBMP 9797]
MERTVRRVTLRDVARAAGVSHQTVSRAINDKGEIDPETRRRILDAARELHYRPSRHARALVRSDLVTVGLIVPDVVNPYFPEFVAGVIAAADTRGWQVVVGSLENDRDRELPLVRSLGRQVDAVVGYLSRDDDALTSYAEGVPLVVVDRGPEPSVHGSVRVDLEAGVRDALHHLIDRGHRRIGMIDCPSVCDPAARRRTFLAVAAERGLPVDGGWITVGEQSLDGGAEAFARLRAAHPDLTAVYAFNDLVAIGALRQARRDGVRVPADCAVIGFDGLSVGELLDPPLSTVHIDKRRLGELAVEQVAARLDGTPAAPAVLRPTLLPRGTT